MVERQPQEQSFSDLIDLFSDPAQSLTEKGDLFEKGCPAPLGLALWLESFLMAGEKPLKKEWTRLSSEAQRILGVELLKCYLFQPLFIRLSGEGRSGTTTPPTILGKQGKLLQIHYGGGPARKIRLFYPLAHSRLWPGVMTVSEEELFSSEKMFKQLEPGLRMAASSRSEKIRQRAETLRAFFLKWQGGSVSRSLKPEENTATSKRKPFNDVEIHAQEPGDANLDNDIVPTQPMTSDPDSVPALPPRPKKKRKGKSASDQMKLF